MKKISNFVTKTRAVLIFIAVVLLGKLVLDLINGALNQSEAIIQFLAAFGSIAAAVVAVWISISGWRREDIRRVHAQNLKTRMIVEYLQAEILAIYDAYTNFGNAHISFLKTNPNYSGHLQFTSESETKEMELALAGVQMRKAFEIDLFKKFGENYMICFEIDPVVGQGLMHLQDINNEMRNSLGMYLPELDDPLESEAQFLGEFLSGKPPMYAEIPNFVHSLLILKSHENYDEWFENRDIITECIQKTFYIENIAFGIKKVDTLAYK